MARWLPSGPARRAALALLVAAIVTVPLVAQIVQEPVDYDAVYRIKEEGLQRSKAMELMSYATDVYGPRLTASPYRAAFTEWFKKTVGEWGLVNVRTEPIPFGRGWTNERFSAHVVSGQPYPLIGYPKAWTPGTEGPVRGEAVIAIIEDESGFAKFKGQLKGKFVLSMPAREFTTPFEPLARRHNAADLEALEQLGDGGQRRRPPMGDRAFRQKLMAFYLSEGVAAVLDSGRGETGTTMVGSGGSHDPKQPPAPCQVSLAGEHYNRIFRTLEKKVPVTIEMDVRNRFHEKAEAYNILAEIPGTDKADEVVLIGGHWDSWHAGTGAADNAAGFVPMMEAMRILKASGVTLRRTVRLALWDGEEQGLIGSREYVKKYLADRQTMQLEPGHSKLSAYFNIDNGTGAIRGVYLQGNEAVAPIFRAWMEPFRSLGMTTLSIRNTGGTDHLSFDAVGVPGFQFIQDPVQYGRTYHTNMDTYERIEASDLMRNSVIVAAFAYHAANREQLLPRKPLPKPAPAGQGRGMF
ncbi:MAG TPA: M20/M25/M40 family metallo-hydrolase [Vicinamibacterales bacterium]|nr:M20/M25/M40 family metallo-hydrolase [Acidobacteriota bacterium]HOC16930.1 M20/M25/M40 family metallo-hydrolase [Vicinamibacterales bacterium]